MRHQVEVQSIETKFNTTRFDLAVFYLRVFMLTLEFKFVLVIKYQ